MFADCLLCQVLFQTRVYKGVSRADRTPGPRTAYALGRGQTDQGWPGVVSGPPPKDTRGRLCGQGSLPGPAGVAGRGLPGGLAAVGEATTEVTDSLGEDLTIPAHV